jgi:hypothetical protein
VKQKMGTFLKTVTFMKILYVEKTNHGLSPSGALSRHFSKVEMVVIDLGCGDSSDCAVCSSGTNSSLL